MHIFTLDVFLQVRLSTQAYAPPTETNLVRNSPILFTDNLTVESTKFMT